MIVVLGIIIALAGLLLPMLVGARESAKRAQCLSNLRQLTAAWIAYANDNDSHICSADLGTPWSWCGPTAGRDQINRDEIFPIPQLETGVLWPYVKNKDVYRCPDDKTDPLRVRPSSFQINLLLGGTLPTSNGPAAGVSNKIAINNPSYFIRLDDVPLHSETFAFIEGASPYMWLHKCFNTPIGNVFHRNGWPGENHTGKGAGTGISFVDGHAMYWQYADPRTINLVEGLTGGIYGPPVSRQPPQPPLYPDNVMVNSPDVLQLEYWRDGRPPFTGP
jgi:hypothetical protein